MATLDPKNWCRTLVRRVRAATVSNRTEATVCTPPDDELADALKERFESKFRKVEIFVSKPSESAKPSHYVVKVSWKPEDRAEVLTDEEHAKLLGVPQATAPADHKFGADTKPEQPAAT